MRKYLEYDQLTTFQAAVAQHPKVVEVIRLYTNDYPNIAGQTFAAIVAHIPLHAPHISSTA